MSREGDCRRDGKGKVGRDIRHEQRAPATVFSVEAFSHVQFRADCLPQEPGGGGVSGDED